MLITSIHCLTSGVRVGGDVSLHLVNIQQGLTGTLVT